MANHTLNVTLTPPSTSSSSAETCLFLQKLPLEIRHEIYDLCVCFPVNSTIYVPTGEEFPPRAQTMFAPLRHAAYAVHGARDSVSNPLSTNPSFVLVFTCRTIRDEIYSRYVGSNMWSFPNGRVMKMFLSGVDRAFVKEIRKLEFVWGGSYPEAQMLALAECINLQTLHIAIDKRKFTEESIYHEAGVDKLLQIRGLKEVDVKVRQITFWHGQQNVTAQFRKDNREPSWEMSFTAQQVADLEFMLKTELRKDGLGIRKLRDTEKKKKAKKTMGTTWMGRTRGAKVAKIVKK